MRDIFCEAGISAKSLSGQTPEDERRQTLEHLRKGKIRIVFSCDLLNEGVDIPEVDTLLFLRPTASATVFQQQLGRGLRLHPGKEQTFVLDFVGRARKEFRFDRPLSVITGLHRKTLLDSFENDRTPKMPRGCSMHLDRQSRDDLLANLKENLQWTVRKVRNELTAWLIREGKPANPSLVDFVSQTGIDLEDIWSPGAGGWTPLLRSVNALPGITGEALSEETEWCKGIGRLLHLDDVRQWQIISCCLRDDLAQIPCDGELDRRLAMLYYQIMNKPSVDCKGNQRPRLAKLWGIERFRTDLQAMGQLLETKSRNPKSADYCIPGAPLAVHCRYQRREILSGLGVWDWESQREWREGVLYCAEQNLDVFAVTLIKDEKHFSPSTRYADCAISPVRFHWKSQSGTSSDSPTGQRYQLLGKGVNRAVLFVREHQDEAYLFLGEVEYLGHEGSKPMGIDFRLKTPMPAKEFQGWASIVAA
jgi:hypothetical protein